MVRFFAVLLALAALAAPLLVAQETIVRRDTLFPVELRTTVKTDSVKIGSTVEFRTNEAVLIGNNIVVPDDAKILGTVEVIRRDSVDSPRSLVRIRLGTLYWKNGSAKLNAVVASVEASPAEQMLMTRHRRNPVQPPSFLRGIRILAHMRKDAYTDFQSEEKDFVLRSGITFLLRQLDPDRDPEMMSNEPLLDVSPPQ
jgi:hypothetical protein